MIVDQLRKNGLQLEILGQNLLNPDQGNNEGLDGSSEQCYAGINRSLLQISRMSQ